MFGNRCRPLLIFGLLAGLALSAAAKSARYRCMWRDDPATTMVIGWDQISGTDPVLYYDVTNHGTNAAAYRMSQRPDLILPSKGMNNHFVRLRGLRPHTVYYFVIRDSEGISRVMSFLTAPDNPSVRLSIIAGGDSRNFREARIDANKIVSKLRPHFVMFDGDMTAGDTAPEWRDWLDDWQYTIGSDGRLFPVIAARGNHEATNSSIVDIFDVPGEEVYYALTIGGNLIRILTLNSLIPSGGSQRDWLQRELAASQHITWRFAQYHHTIRPHTQSKPERDELLLNWATLFHKYRVQLAMESDAHVVKWTYPIRPSNEPGSDQGFIRDDETGTVYIGEGCWGAPLRENNDDKSWTRNSGSFNQFKWIFVDPYRIEVRTVMTDGAGQVQEVDPRDPFEPPRGLVFWSPSNGDVVTIVNRASPPPAREPVAATFAAAPTEIVDVNARQEGSDVIIGWTARNDLSAMKYEVQRTTDGSDRFATIADFSGKGRGINQYACQDKGVAQRYPPQRLRYRLKCILPDGSSAFYEPPQLDPPASLPPLSKLRPDINGMLRVDYQLREAASVDIILTTPELREVGRLSYQQEAGTHQKTFDATKVPAGKYILIIKANGKLVSRFEVIK